jgi:hypothetical protein
LSDTGSLKIILTDRMNASSTSYGQSYMSGFINLLVVVIALVIFYYSFQFFFGEATQSSYTVEPGKLTANQGVKIYANQAQIYEGGEYSVNMWLYISGWKTNQGTRKHVFELGGSNFSTLLVALGAYKNSLSVRVSTKGNSGVDASGNDASGNKMPHAQGQGQGQGGEVLLDAATLSSFFKPLSMDDGLLNVQPSCDIEEIDLQRWTQVSVVINGRTCDVYMDGKLARSCVLPHFYKVDPTGQSVKLIDRAGFDGYISQVKTFNYALTPNVIYQSYMAGPSGSNLDAWAYLKSFFGPPN